MSFMPNVISFCGRAVTPPVLRPRLLIAAARAGQAGWSRNRDLRRLLRLDTIPNPAEALALLHWQEVELNTARLNRAADYDLQRHILCLIAILAETSLAEASLASASLAEPTTKPAVTKALPRQPRPALAAHQSAALSGRETMSRAHL